MNRQECIRRFEVEIGAMIFDNTLCTMNPIDVGSCRGDSGGPLTTQDTPKVLIGVVSWQIPCARGFPDVYARVFPHLQFIRNAMRRLK